jgi:hypothetical protein
VARRPVFERPDRDPGVVDDHVELVGEHDPGAGHDVDLHLDGLLAAAGGQGARADAGAGERVVEERGGAALVRPDPGLAGQVGAAERRARGERMGRREEDTGGVDEERDEFDRRRRRFGRRGHVLEDDRSVQVTVRDALERGRAVDQLVVDLQPWELRVGERDDLGREQRERAEERSEPDAATPEAGQLGHLLLRERQPPLDLGGVPGQQPSGLGRMDALAGAAQEWRTQLRLQQRDLTGDRRLRQREAAGRLGERAGVDDGAEGGQLAGVEHDRSLGTRPDVLMVALNGSAGS